MKILHVSRSPALLVGTAVAAALILAACGSGRDGFDRTATPDGPSQAAPIDAFFASVQGQVSMTDETTGEPIAIDTLVATTNEDMEPVAI